MSPNGVAQVRQAWRTAPARYAGANLSYRVAASLLLDVGEGPLDDIAVSVGVAVELRGPPALAALSFSGRDLVALFRDHRGDATFPEHAPIRPGRIRFVREDRIGTGPRTPTASPGNTDVVEHFPEHGPVVALPASDHDREREAVPVDGMMDLRRQPATRAADTVTCRFNLVKRQILVIRPCPLCPGRDGSCSSRADAHARSSRPRTHPSRSGPPHPHPREGSAARDPTSRRRHTGGDASRSSATARTPPAAYPATASTSGTGR